MEEEEEDMEEDIHLEMEDNSSSHAAQKDEGIHPSHMATLDRLKANQRQDYLRGSISGSVQATDRLMKELRDIYRSDSFKKGELQECEVDGGDFAFDNDGWIICQENLFNYICIEGAKLSDRITVSEGGETLT